MMPKPIRSSRLAARDALRGRHRQVSLAQWVERTWITLGGRACLDRAAYENVHAFFAMLEQLGPEAAGLEEQLAELCAQPDPAASERCGIQLMTIHKAKGLGFDVGADDGQAGTGEKLFQGQRCPLAAEPADFVEERAAVHLDLAQGRSRSIPDGLGDVLAHTFLQVANGVFRRRTHLAQGFGRGLPNVAVR